MPRFKMVVLTAPVEGKDEAFNEWYSGTHVGEVLLTKGFERGQRYKLARHLSKEKSWPYLALYDIEAASAEEAMANIAEKMKANPSTPSDAFDPSQVFTAIYEELGEAQVSEG